MKTPEKWKIQFERLNTSKSPYFSLEDLIAHILLDGMKEGARRAAEIVDKTGRVDVILTSAEQWTEKDLN